MTEQQLEETRIPNDALVKVIQQGDIVEVKWSSNYIHLGCDSNVKRIDKEHYMVRATGEVKEYKHNTVEIKYLLLCFPERILYKEPFTI